MYVNGTPSRPSTRQCAQFSIGNSSNSWHHRKSKYFRLYKYLSIYRLAEIDTYESYYWKHTGSYWWNRVTNPSWGRHPTINISAKELAGLDRCNNARRSISESGLSVKCFVPCFLALEAKVLDATQAGAFRSGGE